MAPTLSFLVLSLLAVASSEESSNEEAQPLSKEEHTARQQELLTKHASQNDVQVLESGLQLRVLEQSTLENVTKPCEFCPIVFSLNASVLGEDEPFWWFDEKTYRPSDVRIPGLSIALLEIRAGEKVEVVIPPSLAFGEHKKGAVPANSALNITVHLISVGEETTYFDVAWRHIRGNPLVIMFLLYVVKKILDHYLLGDDEEKDSSKVTLAEMESEKNPRVFAEFSINGGASKRIVLELFGTTFPYQTKVIRAVFTPSSRLKGSTVQYIKSDSMFQVGNASRRLDIPKWEEESKKIRTTHFSAFLLTARVEKGDKCQYYITTAGNTKLDEDYTVVGQVKEGVDVAKEINDLGSIAGKVHGSIKITQCGELKTKST
eukprot:m.20831 g.20831  ORF g.20831 m.20831 type:complete len:375 (+) comp6966_c0_seq1:30-1154(+)